MLILFLVLCAGARGISFLFMCYIIYPVARFLPKEYGYACLKGVLYLSTFIVSMWICPI